MSEKIEFKSFEEIIKDTGWKYNRNRPMGQEWKCADNFCTNGRGEGFSIHGSTKWDDRNKIIDFLNKRDFIIAKLRKQLKDVKRGKSE